MIDFSQTLLPLFAALLGCLAGVSTAQTTVSYPDATIQAPTLLFPFYTINNTIEIRHQSILPSTFAGLPATAMVATKVGLQIADSELYDKFEIRLGKSAATTLGATFDSNLSPTSPLQVDLSGTVLPGGAGANVWAEFDLAQPFVWTPGESLVLDLRTTANTSYSSSAFNPTGERLYSVGGAPPQLQPANGLYFRIVFEPLLPAFGSGCAGEGGFVPTISSTGSSQIGNTLNVDLSNALGGAPTTLLLGASRNTLGGAPLPLALGAGCALLTSTEFAVPATAMGAGAGNGTASFPLVIPNDPTLVDFAIFAQWLQVDNASGAAIPVVLSDALIIPVY